MTHVGVRKSVSISGPVLYVLSELGKKNIGFVPMMSSEGVGSEDAVCSTVCVLDVPVYMIQGKG